MENQIISPVQNLNLNSEFDQRSEMVRIFEPQPSVNLSDREYLIQIKI